jgi:phage shock protein E
MLEGFELEDAMRLRFSAFLCVGTALWAATPALAKPGSPLIDYPGFEALTKGVSQLRTKRLVPLERFKAMAAKPGTLLLDARSASAFAAGHIDGAVNLPFTDFTAASLAAVIGEDPKRRILIYCNNNFRNNAAPVVTKARPLALNIPTFVNLVGYGYANVWELGEAVDFNDPQVGWVKNDSAPSSG